MEFKNLKLDHTKVGACLESIGATDLVQRAIKPGAHFHYSGIFNGQRFLIQIFVKEKGKCTIGHSSGFDRETFNTLAQAIKDECEIGSPLPLNASIPRFSQDRLDSLLEFLAEQGCKTTEEAKPVYKLVRLEGPLRDILTLKLFNNGTLQMQGVHGQVAGWALDFVQSVIPLNEVLEHQKLVYVVPLTVDEIKRNLEGRVPHVHDYLEEPVKVQLLSSLALTRVGIELADYSALAYPALRGLEGYCFQLLGQEVGLALPPKAKLGEYFDTTGSSFRILSTYKATCSDAVETTLVSCYGLWQKHRHRLFHMDGDVTTSRMLESAPLAVSIVDDVFDTIERGHKQVQRSKGLM